ERGDRQLRVLVTFGGTDPANMTKRLVGPLLEHFDVRAIQPPGKGGGRAIMVEELMWADVVVTSCGRTVHEAAACGTPTIAIAVNEREMRHVHVPGVV